MGLELKGNTSKNSTYLAMMKAITPQKTHPRHMGVKMQAHHVISADAVVMSGIGERLEHFGYDINLKENLVFIPCTMQGACYLGVQPHVGNHSALGTREIESDENDYDDDTEPRSYHRLVAKNLLDEERKFPKVCKENEIGKNSVIKQLDDIAQVILNLIQNQPHVAPLTSVAKHFERGNSIGCGGQDSVPALNRNASACAVDRKHHLTERTGQRKEKIEFISDGKYKLIMGN